MIKDTYIDLIRILYDSPYWTVIINIGRGKSLFFWGSHSENTGGYMEKLNFKYLAIDYIRDPWTFDSYRLLKWGLKHAIIKECK